MAASSDDYLAGILERAYSIIREGITPAEVMSIYTYWSVCYEQDVTYADARYDGPVEAKDAIIRLYSGHKDARILDLCAGTGLISGWLTEAGFTNIDALDASEAMLRHAKKKNIYKNIINHFLDREPIPIGDNTYDGIVSCGCWHLGHLETANCLPELARIVRPGGWIVMAMDVNDLVRYEPTIRQMESEGKWEWAERKDHDSYHYGHAGVVLGIRIC